MFEVDVGVEFLPRGQLISLTSPTLPAQSGPAAVAGSGLGCEELSPAERTAGQSEVSGQQDPASLGQLAAVKCREEVTASQVESQLRHAEESLPAGRAGLAVEHLLAVMPPLVSPQTSGALGKIMTELAGQGRQARCERSGSCCLLAEAAMVHGRSQYG